MKKLLEGIVDFRKNLTNEARTIFSKLALGQKPDALFICCADSRVAPNVFASTNPGDLFVIRNVGNLVPPSGDEAGDSSVPAALEFALEALKVSDIIVCGHSECGAIGALIEGRAKLNCTHLKCWLQHGEPSLNLDPDHLTVDPSLAYHNQVSQANVLMQMEHIASYPAVQERLAAKKLRLHGWWFDIANADVYCFEPTQKRFVLIDEVEAEVIRARLG